MPAMLLSKEEWKEVQKASEAGVDDQQLSEDYGVSKNLIKQKRFQQKWVTPRRVQAEAMLQREKKAIMARVSAGVDRPEGRENLTALTAEQSIASKMLNSAELIGSQIMAVLARKAALVADRPEIIDDPESVADLGTIVNVSRKIAGLDKPEAVGANIALNFGAFWESPSLDGKVVEVEKPRVLEG